MANKKDNKNQKTPKHIINPKPNAKIERDYKNHILEKVALMNKSFKWWLGAGLKKDNPISKIKSEFRELAKYWETKFSDFSKSEASKFIYKIQKHSDSVLHNKNADMFKIKYKSKLINNTMKASINENIALIKSIPREQILRYKSVIYQNIANLDRQNLTQELTKIFKKMEVSDKIAKNRVKTIARDQTKKATEALSQARAQANGFEYYIWITANDERVSGNPSGKYPNAKGGHYHLNNRIYKYGEDTAIIDSYGNIGTCGERVNCRCTSGAVYLMPNETLEKVSDPQHGDYYIIVEKSANE